MKTAMVEKRDRTKEFKRAAVILAREGEKMAASMRRFTERMSEISESIRDPRLSGDGNGRG